MGASDALRAAAEKLEYELALQERLYGEQTRNVPRAKQPFYPTAIAAARIALRAALDGVRAGEPCAFCKEIPDSEYSSRNPRMTICRNCWASRLIEAEAQVLQRRCAEGLAIVEGTDSDAVARGTVPQSTYLGSLRTASDLAAIVRSGFELGMNHDAQEAALDELIERARGTVPPTDGVCCGQTWGDPEVEERTEQMRADEGHPTGPNGGCGRGPVAWKYLYRCAECARWFHRPCILKHFALHTEARVPGKPDTAALETLRRAVRGFEDFPSLITATTLKIAAEALLASRGAAGAGSDPQSREKT